MSVKRKVKVRPYGDSPARLIDQSLLRADATEADIIRLCKGAVKYKFHAVCVQPYYIPLCKAILGGSEIKTAAVIGFPLGMTLKEIKVTEAMQSVLYGAQELDIVINVGALKSGNWEYVEEELAAVINATKTALHKVIIEACYLTDKEKVLATRVALAYGAAFVKTSTGFGRAGATVKDVRLIKGIVKDLGGVKAAGGIKTLAQVRKFLKAGASRIGTSSGVEIMEEFRKAGR